VCVFGLAKDCGMQLTDEPDKRCYPLHGALLCQCCHVRRLSDGYQAAALSSDDAGSCRSQLSSSSGGHVSQWRRRSIHTACHARNGRRRVRSPRHYPWDCRFRQLPRCPHQQPANSHWNEHIVKKVKVAHTRLPSIGFRSWSRFLLPDSVATAIWTRAFCTRVQHANHSATEPHIDITTKKASYSWCSIARSRVGTVIGRWRRMWRESVTC